MTKTLSKNMGGWIKPHMLIVVWKIQTEGSKTMVEWGKLYSENSVNLTEH